MKRVIIEITPTDAWETWECFVPDDTLIEDIQASWFEFDARVIDGGYTMAEVEVVDVEDGF